MKYLALLIVCLAFFVIGMYATAEFRYHEPVPGRKWAITCLVTLWWLFVLNYYLIRKR
jgi:hypothetical protein